MINEWYFYQEVLRKNYLQESGRTRYGSDIWTGLWTTEFLERDREDQVYVMFPHSSENNVTEK